MGTLPDTHADPFDRARVRLLDAMLAHAPAAGWNQAALVKAGRLSGIDESVVAAAFPDGARDILRYWSVRADKSIHRCVPDPVFSGLKIREKVTCCVRARLDVLQPHRNAARRAAAVLSLPVSGTLGLQLAWKTADTIWHALGDRSLDMNYYSKRTILSGVWISTFFCWLADESAGQKDTDLFLERRISNVMNIEKAKTQIRKYAFDTAPLAALLARIRYPSPRAGNEKPDTSGAET